MVGQRLSDHDDVDMISFTGSTEVGRGTMKAAAGNMKKVGLELGGKNPQVVFADADLDAAADGVVFGLVFNAGQCCVSGSRLVVERSIADDFARRVVEKIGRLRIGDPLDEATQVGAIVDPRQHDRCLKRPHRSNLRFRHGNALLVQKADKHAAQSRDVLPDDLPLNRQSIRHILPEW